jgi:hypothetical protein
MISMTLQEISDFVHRPVPRVVPRSVFRAATRENPLRWLFLFGAVFLLFGLFVCWVFQAWSGVGDILLNIGNEKTTNGAIVGWERTSASVGGSRRGGGFTPVYRVDIRFFTPNKEVAAQCYVTGIRSIPGWGQIPESRNERASNASVRLKEPFPVTVEYVPWYPSLSRAVDTRASLIGYFGLVIFIFPLVGIAICVHSWYCRRRTKRLLAEGQYVTGRVTRILTRTARRSKHFEAVVSFDDQNGVERTGFCPVLYRAYSECNRWITEDRSVGLLYLPDRENVLIPDLWLE